GGWQETEGRYLQEGHAPMRISVPAEGDGALADLESMVHYLPPGADGDADDLAWLQIEHICNRHREMNVSSRRGSMFYCYEKSDAQNSYLQNHALWEDGLLLNLVQQTEPTIYCANDGATEADDNALQACIVEANEMMPFGVRVPMVVDEPRSGYLYGSAFVRNACAAAGSIYWYIVPKPSATVSITEANGQVTVSVTSPYTDTWVIPDATIITPTAPSGSGVWVRQTPDQGSAKEFTAVRTYEITGVFTARITEFVSRDQSTEQSFSAT
ncbi:MAG: hypothetical protein KDA99_30950, partial [Planctomycetales bacterium]|nr:hypothetical protein [Planctomycetales bacterium]